MELIRYYLSRVELYIPDVVAMTTAPRGELLHRVREEERTVIHQRPVGYYDNSTTRHASQHVSEEEEMEKVYESQAGHLYTMITENGNISNAK